MLDRYADGHLTCQENLICLLDIYSLIYPFLIDLYISFLFLDISTAVIMSHEQQLQGNQLQLEIFRRKYLQMLDPDDIAYPMEWFIKLPEIQKWIYENMFNRKNVPNYLPYAFRILKKLLFILEAAIEDPEEDVSFSLLFDIIMA